MLRSSILLLLLAVSLQAWSRPLDYEIPEVLEPWVPWVLEGVDRRSCPVTLGDKGRLCAWPGRLNLDLGEAGGPFTQRWAVHAAGWVPLPGGREQWPQDVRDGGTSVAVVERDGRPMVRLEPGEHTLDGRLVWDRMPQGLQIPRETALLELRLFGEPVTFPRIDPDGRLWIGAGSEQHEGKARDTLGLTVLRRVEDENPLLLTTRLEMDVAGSTREAALGPVLLSGGVPLGLDSPLPARLEPDGGLRVQLRPGRWVLEVKAYHPGPVEELALDSIPPPWPAEEVWVFSAHPELRQVEVSGAQAVDPRQTRLPPDWRRFPAYLMRPGTPMRLLQLGRGDQEPAPDRLSLARELWLDFDGGGYSLRDRIEGELTRSWRLEVDKPLQLGRVEEGGSARFITRLEGSERAGVEVRQGTLDMTAVSRIDQELRVLPASGWGLDFQSLEASLNLPPGWKLLALTGADNLPDTWLNRWSLLDLFLVLLIGIGAWRLWGPLWGALALAAMVLSWQEPGAPRFVWLNLLAAVAILRLVSPQPEGTVLERLRRLLGLYYRASLLLLAVLALPFLVDQARLAIYPQLERSASVVLDSAGGPGVARLPVPTGSAPGEAGLLQEEPRMEMLDKAVSSISPERAKLAAERQPQAVERIDPGAMVQTGPGVPAWTWTRVQLGWNGPVPRGHEIKLWLVPPGGNLALAFVRIALILLVGLQAAGLLATVLRRVPAGAALLFAVGLVGLPGPVNARDLPSPELLEDLRGRLLEPPECAPACAAIPRMGLRTEDERLHLELTVDAEEAVAVPVPGGAASWTPTQVRVEGEPFDGLYRSEDGSALLTLPPGRWRVELTGPLPQRAQVEVPLPLRPRLLVADTPGFQVQGIGADGRTGDQIRLLRLAGEASAASTLEPAEIPPLVRVVRTLRLGLDWRVETRVRRLSPPRFPLVLEVPLIPGEQVLDEDVRVSEGRLLVNLPAGRQEMGWRSGLEPVDRIELLADEDPRLSEEWRVDVSPQWHLEVEGIPAVHHQGRLERWLPTWRPWPGEGVRLTLSRPAGVPGPTLTLTGSEYRVAPGRRSANVSLDLTLLSSQGARHRLRLPVGAELNAVRIDGRERPLRLSEGELTLPLVPATQRVEIEWRQPAPMGLFYSPPLPDLGTPGVNSRLSMDLGPDRWVLFVGGPALGPAVLFWGLVVVLVLISVGLGRSRFTPLRTWDWLLLGLGLSQAGIWTALLVAGWLFALGMRGRLDRDLPPWRFNLMQVSLVVLSLAALGALIGAVEQGLLGLPEMQIAGNGSSSERLIWFQDRSEAELPRIWVFSVPILVYRGLMLAWALWLAFRLVAWLRWGWQGLSSPMIWREMKLRLSGRRRSAADGRTSVAGSPTGASE